MTGQPAGPQPGTTADAGATPADSGIAWYLGRDGQQFGPLGNDEFRRLFEGGQLLPTDLVWRDGFADWRPVASLQLAQPATVPVTPQQPARSQPSASAPSRGAQPVTRQPQHQPSRNSPVTGYGAGVDAGRAASEAPQAVHATRDRMLDERSEKKQKRARGERSASVRRGGRSILRGFAWSGIVLFFGVTLWACDLVAKNLWPTYTGLLGEKGLLQRATVFIPSLGGDRVVSTAPIGGFAKTAEATDIAMQKSLLWQVLKKNHPVWYEARVRDATAASVANKTDAEIANALMQEVVKLRRQFAAEATSAPLPRLKSIASMFAANLVRLRAQSVDACFQFVSAGEGAPAVVALLQSAEHTSPLQAQLAATFEAIAEGRGSPRIYPQPKPEDYDELVKILELTGWKNADLQLFSDSAALAKATPDTVCRLVTQWFESQLAIKNSDTQLRLIVDSLRPVVAG